MFSFKIFSDDPLRMNLFQSLLFLISVEVISNSQKSVISPQDASFVTFGASYPGMLSSWARLLYPSRIAGAVASSAPVQASLEFPEYNDVVGSAFASPVVGGSVRCAQAIHEAHQQGWEKKQ